MDTKTAWKQCKAMRIGIITAILGFVIGLASGQ